ncbi:amidohydrolase family protein [Lewinella sp. IMCC34191]|uniref:amidohydrolase family protein n=1 Tax=Lewinella sp. IMCC34191 TaxID=2259172 RepID=UPI000E242B21|nr:amidohydrolase family protein [Lewinella sp. IMCC34191]
MDCNDPGQRSFWEIPLVAIFALLALPLAGQERFVNFTSPRFAITHVTLIDGSGTAARYDQHVVVDGGAIVATGPADSLRLPPELPTLDGKGKTLIPGIVGVHNHLHMPGRTFLGPAARLYLAAGVTTMMTCGAAEPDREIALMQSVEAGEVAGPEIVPSAPYISGPGGNPNMIIADNEDRLRDTIRYWSERGVKWFKVYRHTRPEDLAVVVDEAHRHGARVTGHLCATTLAEAARIGIDGIEHGLNSANDFRPGKTPGNCDGSMSYMDRLDVYSAEVTRLLRTLVDRGVFLTSTLSIYEASIPGRYPPDERALQAMTPALRSRYSELPTELQDSARLRRLHRIMAFERRFVELGGLLAAGPDPGRHNLPGYGDQRNHELLREAGFSAGEAIRIMTYNGATVLGRDDIGRISPGMRADLVLLDGDLSSDPTVIRSVNAVFRAGIGYDVAALTTSVAGQIGPEN